MNASRRLGTTTDVRRSQLLWQGTPQPTQLRRPAPSLTSIHFTWRLDQPPLSSWLDCASLALLLPPPPTHGRPNKLLSTCSQTCCPSPVIIIFSYDLTSVIFTGLGRLGAALALALPLPLEPASSSSSLSALAARELKARQGIY